MADSPLSQEINESLIFSVSEVTFHIKQVMETQIEALYISGEISNFVRHGSGHLYFNLKDEGAVIRCAFFRNQNYMLDFSPQDGDQVVCFGKVSVFEKSGQYQLIVQSMIPYGKGALQQRFEQLKTKLKAEGLFDTKHKKYLPKYPDTIGIITSPTGAALQDILNIISRRYPCRIKIFPSLMQGQDAAKQVISGLDYFNAANNVDLIIIARGGGSQEDLFSFNDEQLARKIFASVLPVVSAIGHEIDFTIADFVADLRAPTPSAAAEIVTPDRSELESALSIMQERMVIGMQNMILSLRNQYQNAKTSLWQHNPVRKLQSLQQRLDFALNSFSPVKNRLVHLRKDLDNAQKVFGHELSNLGRRLIAKGYYRLDLIKSNMQHEIKSGVINARHSIEIMKTRLEDLSPMQLMEKGYSVVLQDGKTINSIHKVNTQKDMNIIFKDGSADVKITSLQDKAGK